MGIAAISGIVGYMSLPVTVPQTRVMDYVPNGTISNGTALDPIPVTTPIRPDYDESRIAHLIHDKINGIRIQNGLPPLEWNAQIATVATSHSNDMMANGYFDHNDLQGNGPDKRGIDSGFALCGDHEAIQFQKDFEIHQNNVNQQAAQLNQFITTHNAHTQDYNQRQAYMDQFRPDDFYKAGLMHKEFTELSVESDKLETESNRFNSENAQLDQENQILNNLIEQKRIASGFSENIVFGYTYSSSNGLVKNYDTEDGEAQKTIDSWMNSPGHRENILTPWWNEEGLGVKINPDTDELFVTQNFC